MTENQKQLKIAFVKNNYSLKGYKEQEVWSGARAYKDSKNLIDNKEFEVTLTYKGFTRGRSALNIRWADEERKIIYYSGMSLLDKALEEGIIEGNVLRGNFCFKKQGTSILLERL